MNDGVKFNNVRVANAVSGNECIQILFLPSASQFVSFRATYLTLTGHLYCLSFRLQILSPSLFVILRARYQAADLTTSIRVPSFP
jgi:hypothetical protein